MYVNAPPMLPMHCPLKTKKKKTVILPSAKIQMPYPPTPPAHIRKKLYPSAFFPFLVVVISFSSSGQ